MCAYNKQASKTTASLLDACGLNISRHLAWVCNGIQEYNHGRWNVFK